MFLGVDLGTSSVKILLVDKQGKIFGEVNKQYPLYHPQNNYSEQNPIDWWNAVKVGIKEVIEQTKITMIDGISFSGQMHGLVILTENDEIIRPCILWNDARTEQETKYLNEVIGKEKLVEYTGNICFAGFTAPKILWVKNNEPANFKKISKIMLPKDYLAYQLSGVFATDYSDASGTLLLDVKNKCWNKQMLDICGITEKELPKLVESYDGIGYLKESLQSEFGLTNQPLIVMGAADNPASAVGAGIIDNQEVNISLGTSGTIFISLDKFLTTKDNSLHMFCHASSKWYLMGCILNAASATKWWDEQILKSTHQAEQELITKNLLGNNDVYFLPYLTGERCPHNDTYAKGSFIGLTSTTTKAQMNLAVLEGVAFSLKECLEIAKENGIQITKTKICGGGANSKLWLEVITNVLGIPVEILSNPSSASFGATILAMVGTKTYQTVEEASKTLLKAGKIIYPNPLIQFQYEKRYQKYKLLYPALKDVFQKLN